jgi:hypothetical protein
VIPGCHGGLRGHRPRLAYARETFFANGTLTTPATFYGLDGVLNRASVHAIGAGGGSAQNAGAGGGGEYRGSILSLTPSTGYTVVVGTGAINTDGGATTFATTTIVANGGKSQANGSAGGTGGTGTTGRAGGAGEVGTGNKIGGAASGSVSGASGTTPGEVEPGVGAASLTGGIGCGGGSQTANEVAGSSGLLWAEYLAPPTVGFPWARGVTQFRDATAATTRDIVLPSGVNGDLLLVWFAEASDTATMSATGWTGLTSRGSTSITGQWFYRVADGSDGVAFATSASVLTAGIVLRMANAGTPTENGAGSSSQNPDPSSISFSSGDYRVISGVAIRGNGGVNLQMTGAPAGYGNAIVMARRASGAPYIMTAGKNVSGTSEDPGAWSTSASAANGRSTIAIPYAA